MRCTENVVVLARSPGIAGTELDRCLFPVRLLLPVCLVSKRDGRESVRQAEANRCVNCQSLDMFDVRRKQCDGRGAEGYPRNTNARLANSAEGEFRLGSSHGLV